MQLAEDAPPPILATWHERNQCCSLGRCKVKRASGQIFLPAESNQPRKSTRRPLHHSILFIVLIAFLLRLAVITVGHTYRITPRRDHFQFGWEMGRLARSIAEGQGFSSPTDLPTGPSAWAPPLYPYILAGVFKLFGVYSALSAWVILAFNSIFAALTCLNALPHRRANLRT